MGNTRIAVGSSVTAVETIREGRHVHAREGDVGQVLHLETAPDGVELLTVLWARSGTVATVSPGEGGNVRLVELERVSTPAERADTSARMARARAAHHA